MRERPLRHISTSNEHPTLNPAGGVIPVYLSPGCNRGIRDAL